MGLTELVKTVVIVPEYKITEVIRELYDFEWFHVEEKETELDEKIIEAYEALRKLGLDLDTLISSLNISVEAGVIDQLVGKYRVYKERIEAEDVRELIERLKNDAEPLIRQARESMETQRKAKEELKQVEVLHSTLKTLLDFNIDPARIQRLKRFYVVFTVVETGAINEIKRSLIISHIIDVSISKNLTALLIISPRGEEERVERVLRGFGVKPFNIPPNLPQNISEAYNLIVEEEKKLEEVLKKAEEELEKIREEAGMRIVALREAVRVVEELLNRLGRKSGLKRFRIISGYIPRDAKKEFQSRFGERYGIFFEEKGKEYEHHTPTLLNNKSVVKSFENITLIQGFPRGDEIDPTPFVTVFFSIFYGIMFADLGQGLVLALFGLYMYRRVRGNLKEWAKLLTILGLSAAIAGFIIGEAFGFKIYFPFPKPEVLHLVEGHSKTAQFNMSEVLKLIQFTLFLGAAHLTIGYVLSFKKALKHREYVEAFTARLPTIIMYIFSILFVLCFFGAGGEIAWMMSSENPVPYLGVPTKTLAPIAIGGAVLSMSIIILGRTIMEGVLKKKGGIVGLIGEGLLEVLENIIHFMSNSLSYVRITVLLLVHTALLMLLNASWHALGWSSLPILIIGNIGIMALEGLMVFIQSLRLHLYEFFTKFYEGTGTPFKKIKPDTSYVEIVFRR